MADRPASVDGPFAAGCGIALLLGIAVAAGTAIAFQLLTGRAIDLGSEAGPLASQALLAAAPFAALALAGARRPLPWLSALAPTLLLWGWFLAAGLSYQWHPDGTGANIGLGLIMLASPLPIGAVGLAVHFRQKRRR